MITHQHRPQYQPALSRTRGCGVSLTFITACFLTSSSYSESYIVLVNPNRQIANPSESDLFAVFIDLVSWVVDVPAVSRFLLDGGGGGDLFLRAALSLNGVDLRNDDCRMVATFMGWLMVEETRSDGVGCGSGRYGVRAAESRGIRSKDVRSRVAGQMWVNMDGLAWKWYLDNLTIVK